MWKGLPSVNAIKGFTQSELLMWLPHPRANPEEEPESFSAEAGDLLKAIPCKQLAQDLIGNHGTWQEVCFVQFLGVDDDQAENVIQRVPGVPLLAGAGLHRPLIPRDQVLPKPGSPATKASLQSWHGFNPNVSQTTTGKRPPPAKAPGDLLQIGPPPGIPPPWPGSLGVAGNKTNVAQPTTVMFPAPGAMPKGPPPRDAGRGAETPPFTQISSEGAPYGPGPPPSGAGGKVLAHQHTRRGTSRPRSNETPETHVPNAKLISPVSVGGKPESRPPTPPTTIAKNLFAHSLGATWQPQDWRKGEVSIPPQSVASRSSLQISPIQDDSVTLTTITPNSSSSTINGKVLGPNVACTSAVEKLAQTIANTQMMRVHSNGAAAPTALEQCSGGTQISWRCEKDVFNRGVKIGCKTDDNTNWMKERTMKKMSDILWTQQWIQSKWLSRCGIYDIQHFQAEVRETHGGHTTTYSRAASVPCY